MGGGFFRSFDPGAGIVLTRGGVIINSGTIDGGGGVRTGIVLSGGRVENGSRADETATISGILTSPSPTAPVYVRNFGMIRVGITLDDNFNNTVVNFGTITAHGTAIAFGGGNDHLIVGPGAVFNGIVDGGAGRNEIEFRQAGTISLAPEFIGFSIVRLGDGGANSLALTGADFMGLPPGTALTVYGGNNDNTIDASVLTVADRVILVGGAGPDVFEFSATGLTNADLVRGRAGTDELLMTSSGRIEAGGISGVELYVLAGGGANTLALTDTNFAGVRGRTITIDDGNSGNRIDAAMLAADVHIVVHAGSGRDVLLGGAGNDIFYAGGKTTMTGGRGANEFIFSAPGRNNVIDFHAFSGDELVFSNSGFDLGLKGAGEHPRRLPAYLFVANETGTFTTKRQRFAYDTTTGQLFYDAHGSATPAARELVVTLDGDPHLGAANLFFIT